MALIERETGQVITDEQAQELIRETIKRTGRFILHAIVPPPIGEVQDFAGLPFRAGRLVTLEEAKENHCPDLWGEWDPRNEDDVFFEVEVAD